MKCVILIAWMLRTRCSLCAGTSTCSASVARCVVRHADRRLNLYTRGYISQVTAGQRLGARGGRPGGLFLCLAAATRERPPRSTTNLVRKPHASRHRSNCDQYADDSKPVRRKRGEGQWALGYREPLNKNEESKKYDDPLHVRQRIIDIYAKQGFDSIDPADLRGRFRWYGPLHPAPHRASTVARPPMLEAGGARRPSSS